MLIDDERRALLVRRQLRAKNAKYKGERTAEKPDDPVEYSEDEDEEMVDREVGEEEEEGEGEEDEDGEEDGEEGGEEEEEERAWEDGDHPMVGPSDSEESDDDDGDAYNPPAKKQKVAKKPTPDPKSMQPSAKPTAVYTGTKGESKMGVVKQGEFDSVQPGNLTDSGTGDVVFIFGDAQSRKVDFAAGYKLGLSVAIVQKVLSRSKIKVCYMWSVDHSWRGRWQRWQQKRSKE